MSKQVGANIGSLSDLCTPWCVRAGRFALNQAAQGLREPSQRLGLDLEGIGGRLPIRGAPFSRTSARALQPITSFSACRSRKTWTPIRTSQ